MPKTPKAPAAKPPLRLFSWAPAPIRRVIRDSEARESLKARGMRGVKPEALERAYRAMLSREVSAWESSPNRSPDELLERIGCRERELVVGALVDRAMDRLGIADKAKRARVRQLALDYNAREMGIGRFGRAPKMREDVELRSLARGLNRELGPVGHMRLRRYVGREANYIAEKNGEYKFPYSRFMTETLIAMVPEEVLRHKLPPDVLQGILEHRGKLAQKGVGTKGG